MKRSQTCLALLLAFSAANLHAAPAFDAKSSQPEAIALIRANDGDFDRTADKTDVASIQGTDVSSTVADERMFSTVLPGNVVYWRAASFTLATSWDDMTAQAGNAKPTGLVLDLRSNTAPSDIEGAQRVDSFLSQAQTGVTVIVLTDRNTRGAAETLAASLQARGALVMGQATSDKSAAHSVVPDVTTPVPSKEEAAALALIDRQQVTSVIAEDTKRHRMCEAALVRGQDPEQDSFIAAHEAPAAAPQAPATRDLALVEALDSLKAIRVVQGEESSPQTRVADSSSVAGQSVIASSGLGR